MFLLSLQETANDLICSEQRNKEREEVVASFLFGFGWLTKVTVIVLKCKSSCLIEGGRDVVSELTCLPWVRSAACHSFTGSVHCFKNTEGISLSSSIDFHLLAVTEIFSALLPANIYFAFFILL